MDTKKEKEDFLKIIEEERKLDIKKAIFHSIFLIMYVLVFNYVYIKNDDLIILHLPLGLMGILHFMLMKKHIWLSTMFGDNEI